MLYLEHKNVIIIISAEVEKIKRRQTAEIEKILGEKRYDEIVHRDNMVVIEGGQEFD